LYTKGKKSKHGGGEEGDCEVNLVVKVGLVVNQKMVDLTHLKRR
jgi:hypothetical protein